MNGFQVFIFTSSNIDIPTFGTDFFIFATGTDIVIVIHVDVEDDLFLDGHENCG